MSEAELEAFNHIAYAYRTCPMIDQEAVCARFNDLVDFVNAMLAEREEK